jgi:RNA polymerase sigma-70 factor (ECF subfamily)
MTDFHLLLEEQIPGLMRYASALTRDSDEAGELVEDTVRDALANRSDCEAAADRRVWLLTTLHDLRGNPFRQMTLATALREPSAQLTLSDLDRALAQLSEEHRAIILLIGLEGMSYADTARILRISAASLRSRLSRARAILGRAMGVEDAARPTRVAA